MTIYILIWACIELCRFIASVALELILVRTMWCEKTCNVCYSMLKTVWMSHLKLF
jgi:hypothetical protein